MADEEVWHSLTEKDVVRLLESSENGLTEKLANERLQRFGANELVREVKRKILSIFLDQFKSFLIIILIIAAIISLLIGELVDGSVILLIVLVNAFLGFYQEFKAEQALEALKKMSEPKSIVLRDGNKKEISSNEIVPGDIIFLEEGKYVPADARLIKTEILKVDESSLTGESLPVQKEPGVLKKEIPVSDMKNMVFSGTHVAYGHGHGIVVSTGMQTQLGKIAAMVQSTERETTPLQQRLEVFGRQIGIVMLVIVAFVFLIGYYKHAATIFELFLFSVSLAIAAIPEGLPAVVTLTLAIGTQEMAKHKAIVRKLLAVETLGSVSVICSDKTGTLTKNEMTVTKIFTDGEFFQVSGIGYEPVGEFFMNKKKIDPNKITALNWILKTSALCNNASFTKIDGHRLLGDPTEGALLVICGKAGLNTEKMREENKFVTEFPFTSERKMMSKVYSDKEGYHSYVKGAPEVILKNSSHIQIGNSVRPLTENQKKQLEEISKEMASEPLRVLAFAYKKVPKEEKYSLQQLEENLVFTGFVGMIDPPREEVRDAIKVAKQAGIKTVMITGDHKVTAISVAKNLGIIEKNDMVVTGFELESMSQHEFEEIVEDVAVYARVTPEQKMKILQAFETKGHVVAMTGDGVNDAPALKRADVGVSMGIAGTDVAKGASDLILQDDNYATIVTAIQRGRNIYDNIRKFMRFVLAANFAELSVVTFASLAGLQIPLTPLQILWINIVTDTLPATALAVDPPENDLMRRPPRKKGEAILNPGMLGYLVTTSVLMCLVALWVYLWGLQWGIEKARTLVFSVVVVFQLFLIFNCRSENKNVLQMNPFSNKYLIAALISAFLLQFAVIYIAPLQSIFGTYPLDLFDWGVILLFSISAFAISPTFFFKREKLTT